MSGKPGAAKTGAAARSAPEARAVEKTERASSAGKTASAGGKSDAKSADLAADAAPSAARAVARVVPKKTVQATLAVRCPMCETSGFVPMKAAGRPVRCAKLDCLVPVFTAPEPPPQPVKGAPAAVPANSNRRMAVLVAGSVVVALAGGVVAWLVFVPRGTSRPAPSVPVAVESDDEAERQRVASAADSRGSAGEGSADAVSPAIAERNASAAAAAEARRSSADLLRGVLATMVPSAVNADQARKKDCRRLAAESFAKTGDLDAAREQIKQLRVVARDADHYLVTPLVAIAWRERAAGKSNDARATTDEAVRAAAKLPTIGQLPFESSVSLAALLIAGDRAGDAEPLATGSESARAAEESWSRIVAARALGSFDPEAEFALRMPLPSHSPKSAAIVFELAGRGAWDAASHWVERRENPQTRLECALALIEASAVLDPEGTEARVESLIAGLPEKSRSLLFARAALRRQVANDSDGAAGYLERARAELASIPEPQPVRLPPTPAEVRDFEVRGTAAREAAVAFGEISRVEALRGDHESAWLTLRSALAHTRATAPPLPAVEALQSQVRANENGVSESLRSALGLRTDLQVRDAFQAYRRKLGDLRNEADARFLLQSRLLEQGIAGGLADPIRTMLLADDAPADFPFEASSVPRHLADAFESAGRTADAEAIRQAAAAQFGQPDTEPAAWFDSLRMIREENPRGAAARIEGASHVGRDVRSEWVPRLVVRMVDAGRLEDAARFLAAIRDPLLREPGYQWLAARAARRGDGDRAWNLLEQSRLSPPERVAAAHGVLSGLLASESE